jgi:hypothetical protein
MAGGPGLSARQEEEERTPSGYGDAGPWADCKVGPNRSPWPFSYFLYFFSFSFSVFRFVSISFANLVQIDSNKSLYYSNIQHNLSKQ